MRDETFQHSMVMGADVTGPGAAPQNALARSEIPHAVTRRSGQMFVVDKPVEEPAVM